MSASTSETSAGWRPVQPREVMLEAATRAHPREACGVIIDGAAYEVPNVAADPLHHYAMDLRVLQDLIEEHGYPEATWHSHPRGSTEPSVNDVDCQPPGLRLLLIANGEVHDHGCPT